MGVWGVAPQNKKLGDPGPPYPGGQGSPNCPARTLKLPSVQRCRTYLASASGVPVRSPLTTCLPRLAARGCPVFCARSPTGVVGASLPLRPWPIGGPHVLSTQWERSLQGLDPVHRYRAVQVSTNTHGERILQTLSAAHRQCE